ncbi:hypothetical protein K431DRAFT_322527 [Polychaeton citri CBS 116435]|uniref:Aminoglycoside phosphotransferase domain-containing protein n=1 Tax=Polychaeton citri CBS 116435 TaxID=1314669 RepID=A0A9P4Q510_9PEZI|nr:hypothetical protein K431DRAFT_322527 [Polychaeton citri CBS 116435]
MTSSTQTVPDHILDKITQQLSTTRYASILKPLSGGTVNFVFRGILAEPIAIPDGITSKTIIVKHSTEFLAVNKDFAIDISRCVNHNSTLFTSGQESMLNVLNNFPSNLEGPVVKAPYLYFFDKKTNTQILEDFPSAVDLKSILVSPSNNEVFTPLVAAALGWRLGSWLRSFHDWTSRAPQAGLTATIGQNKAMRDLKYLVTYDSFLKVLENFPKPLEGVRETLEEVKAAAEDEFRRSVGDPIADGREGWGVIHGDFWTGNVLVPEVPPLQAKTLGEAKSFVVDWEFVQFGHRAYDVGQMIGCLYERKHFKNANGAIAAIEKFVRGYGQVSDDFAFRSAIHTGIHLIGWYTRRPANAPLPFALTEVEEIIRLGRDFILKAWVRDKKWFAQTLLASFFER